MGQCGCGDFYGDFKLKAPDGNNYIIQIYKGCKECNMPAGIIIYNFDKEEGKSWDVDHIQEIEIPNNDQRFISILNIDQIKNKMVSDIEFMMNDLMDETSLYIRDAIHKTVDKENDHLKDEGKE